MTQSLRQVNNAGSLANLATLGHWEARNSEASNPQASSILGVLALGVLANDTQFLQLSPMLLRPGALPLKWDMIQRLN